MLKFMKNVLVLSGSVALLILIAYLPKMAAAMQDKEILTQPQYESMQSVQLEIRENLSALGKLALVRNMSSGNNIEISKEEALMSVEEVNAAVDKALAPYISAGLIQPFEESYREWRPLWMWDDENLEINGIVWEGYIVGEQDGYHVVNVLIDDETGNLLFIQYNSNYALEYSMQEEFLSKFCEIYFGSLEITDFANFETRDLVGQYIGDDAHGIRYRFGDLEYGEINIDFYIYLNGFYVEFPKL